MPREHFDLVVLDPARLPAYKAAMQEAFQKGSEAHFGVDIPQILPERDIDEALENPTAVAYEALVDGEPAGGAIVSFQDGGAHGDLDFLFVRTDVQSKGVGRKIWRRTEELYPSVKVWETCTPYFERRNLHFYINRLGFSAVEYFNGHHQEPEDPEHPERGQRDDPMADLPGGEDWFRFEKRMG